ncbi:hypothetical protein IQ249_09765 [Lusitaniella coriacea LEGE 07157]|uniref:Uncharacterized protein n=1 Tax=Lusitaniella coriacea LEGE 07157 TaxID=945747 RepID=A0A8J7DW23_9CYAN|nr:hypothetical protein [Lusitaniella coriacea]MBE9116181.1 hypothetical protein [Lusitaniella coriacea LEGE 07157]
MISKDISKIRKKINPLLGKQAWNVSLGHGSFITLEFGRPCLPAESSAKIHGEWHLWVYCCAWRLEKENRVIAASEDPRSKLEEAVKNLEGLVIQSINLLNPALDTVFIFEQQIVLRLFSIHSQDYEHWMLFTPDENVLTIGPGTDWSYESRTE